MRYKKKPVVINTLQWKGFNWNEMWDFLDVPKNGRGKRKDGEMKVEIFTLEGTVTASIGDYIIQGVQGEFYPCKPDIFGATYDSIQEVNTND